MFCALSVGAMPGVSAVRWAMHMVQRQERVTAAA